MSLASSSSSSRFDLLRDAKIQAKLIACDPALSRLFKEVDPASVPSSSDPPKSLYAAMLGIIIGQRISYKAAKAIRGRLYQAMGNRSNFEAEDTMRQLTMTDWCKKIGVGDKIYQVVQTFEYWCVWNKGWTVESLREANLKGIKEWTLDALELTLLIDMDIFPIHDAFLAKRVQRLYNLPRKPSPQELLTLSRKWAPYRSIVCWWMWRWF